MDQNKISDPYVNRILQNTRETYEHRKIDRQRNAVLDRPFKRVNNEERFHENVYYCIRCDKDFKADGIKRVVLLDDEKPYAFYTSQCITCNYEVVRRITDKADDEYYNLSSNIREQRQMYVDDMLSPYFARFRVLYGNEEDEKRAQENEAVEQKLYEQYGIEGVRSYTPSEITRYKQNL